MRRLKPDPVMGDVVRARLDALVAEITPRRPADEEGGDPFPDEGGWLTRDESPVAAEPPAGATGPAGPAPSVQALLARAGEFGRAHLAVVGIVGLIGLVGAVWALTQARTVPVAVAAPTAVAPSLTPSPSPSPEPVRVHVLGAVVSPGVVRLEPGARVEDAIEAAGGLAAGARPGDLNLAAVVADGIQVFVGDAGTPGGELRGAASGAPGGAAAGGSGAKVDLNTATLEQLDGLPGVGPVTAQAILAWRAEHTSFSRIEELQEVDGIGPKTFERIAPLVGVR